MITSPKLCATIRNDLPGLATIPLQDPDLAARELERCVRELGLRGAEIGTHVDANPTFRTRRYFRISIMLRSSVSGARRNNSTLRIFVHPWDMLGKERMPKYWLPWLVGMPAETSLAICSMIFGGVFERFPKLRVAFAHGGGAFPFTIGRIEHAFHVRPDLYATTTTRNPAAISRMVDTPARFYVDSLVHDADALKLLLKLFGPQRVALGSDYPFPLGEARPGKLIESMKLSAKEKAQLFSGTACDFLGYESVIED